MDIRPSRDTTYCIYKTFQFLKCSGSLVTGEKKGTNTIPKTRNSLLKVVALCCDFPHGPFKTMDEKTAVLT